MSERIRDFGCDKPVVGDIVFDSPDIPEMKEDEKMDEGSDIETDGMSLSRSAHVCLLINEI